MTARDTTTRGTAADWLADVLPQQRAVHRGHVSPALTVIVPTRNEAENIVPLLDRLEAALDGLPAEVVIVDDSTDDTPAVVDQARRGRRMPVLLKHRSGASRWGGLGGAVVDGLRAARAPYAVVMDGDLQHPPEVLPALYRAAVESGTDIVVGSRYRGEGTAEGLAGPARKLVSSGANLVARLAFPRRLRGVTDAMSGLFLVRVGALDLEALNPSGYKILLEILVRTKDLAVTEVGYTFAERHAGESNASMAEGLRFGRHLFWLRVPRPARFAVVGASGLVPNILGTALLTRLGVVYLVAAVIATMVANLWNFAGCELVVWTDRPGSRTGRLLPFMVVNSLDLVVRLPLLMLLVDDWRVGVSAATFLTLLLAFFARYLLIDRLVYRFVRPVPAHADLT